MPLLGGLLLDTYPGAEGYRYFYSAVAILCVIGCLAAYAIMRKAARPQALHDLVTA